MKTLNFNKNSLHYKLATLGGFDRYNCYYDGSTDICSYLRRVMMGVFVSIILLMTFVFASTLVVHTLFGLVFSFIYDTDMFNVWGQVGLLTAGISSLFAFIWIVPGKIMDLYYSIKSNRPEKPAAPDNFVREAYSSYKEKYCVKIKFHE